MIRDQLAAIARPYARALMAVPGSDRAALLASLEAVAQALSDPAIAALAENPGSTCLARDARAARSCPTQPTSRSWRASSTYC